MRKLVANFDVKLPSHLFIKDSKDKEFQFKVRIDDFHVVLLLIPEGSKFKKGNERYFSFPISRVKLLVAREEFEEPPPVKLKKNNIRDYSAHRAYFEKRLPIYRNVALTVLNRLITFFKYKLHTPLLQNVDIHYQNLQSPKWADESGREVGTPYKIYLFSPIPGLMTDAFGVKRLTSSEEKKLIRALRIPIKPKLYEELLSDAQTSIFQDDIQRSILEMAISCEIAIKEAFFAKESAAGAAYEHFEDKGRIHIRVTELIGEAAKEAFGESFKEAYEEAYRNIDLLFRCRNKIVHRGQVIYRDDSNVIHEVNKKDLESWWESIEILFNWLEKHKSKTGNKD